jgi:ribonuclease T2
MCKHPVAAAAWLLLFASSASACGVERRPVKVGTDKDVSLVMSLSWSPEYCAGHPNDRNQCGTDRHFRFVLHGLWPQYGKGWPEFCSQEALPGAVRNQFSTLYPSAMLMAHEWSKHGTCSGLSATDYFSLSKASFEKVAIPGDYTQPAQPISLSGQASALLCKKKHLQEVRVCLDATGSSSKECGGDVVAQERSTRKGNVVLRAVR